MFHEGASRHGLRQSHLVQLNSVVEISAHLSHYGLGRYSIQPLTGGGNLLLELHFIQRFGSAVLQSDMKPGLRECGLLIFAFAALLRSFFAIENIGARHLVFAAAHQRQFNLILNVFNVDRPGGVRAPGECIDDLLCQSVDRFMDTP